MALLSDEPEPRVGVTPADVVYGEDRMTLLHYKPMVRWIWLGPIFMAFGAFVTLLDKRYRSRRVASTSRNVSPAGAEVASA